MVSPTKMTKPLHPLVLVFPGLPSTSHIPSPSLWTAYNPLPNPQHAYQNKTDHLLAFLRPLMGLLPGEPGTAPAAPKLNPPAGLPGAAC
jgi:hypothetical protein